MKLGAFHWKIGRPYIHRPFHPSLPTMQDWKRLLIASALLALGLSHYIVVGYHQGWRVGVHEFAVEGWNELKADWRGQ